MLNVCASASSTDGALITTAYYRSVLGATSTADDATQLIFVQAASQWAVDYVGYPLLAQTYSETLTPDGSRDLLLSRHPVRVVLRLFDSSSTDSATEYCSTDYRVDDEVGSLRRPSGWAATPNVNYHLGPFIAPNTELETWYTEYTAGYVVGGLSTGDTIYSTAGVGGSTSTGETLPNSIKLAVALKAVAMGRAGATIGISAKSIGDLSITYGSNRDGGTGTGLTPERLLDDYRSAL